jgi:hypothetical protein
VNTRVSNTQLIKRDHALFLPNLPKVHHPDFARHRPAVHSVQEEAHTKSPFGSGFTQHLQQDNVATQSRVELKLVAGTKITRYLDSMPKEL